MVWALQKVNDRKDRPQALANRDSERGKREITEFFEKVLEVANRSPNPQFD
jgi:hypothetical protein